MFGEHLQEVSRDIEDLVEDFLGMRAWCIQILSMIIKQRESPLAKTYQKVAEMFKSWERII